MRWEYKTLDELGSISRGRSKHRPRNDETLFGGKFPFVQTADVKKANLYLTEYEGKESCDRLVGKDKSKDI